MKRWRVPVEVYEYHGVYVEAKDKFEAISIVQKMIDEGEDINYDDDGDSDTRVVEDYPVEEVDNDGNVIIHW